MSDEAHRSQYGMKGRLDTKTGKYVFGYAKHLRDALKNATFIGFTGTPIALEDKDTRAVFGDYVSIYDIQDAVDDGATVPIFYESRLAKLDVKQAEIDALNAQVDEVVEDEEDTASREKTKSEWAALEKLVGAEPRLQQVAKDLVQHFEARISTIDGKAMIVCMSRDICAQLYSAIVALRPEWHSADPEQGTIKIVMTGSAADKALLQPHIYTHKVKKRLEKRFKDPKDSLKLVIVRDMWLTGFDAPSCHTMYVDKPMKGANLMQAIARVNRVFRDKQGGLLVYYIGIATELKDALATYTKGKKAAAPVEFIEEALGVFFEKLTIVRDLLHGTSIEGFQDNPHAAVARIADFIIGLEDGKKRFADATANLSKAYSLVTSQAAAIPHREEVTLYHAIRVMLTKVDHTEKKKSDAERELLIKQALSRGIVPEGIIDVFSVAGLDRPDIGLLSEEFLREIRAMKEKNLAVEALSRLLKGEIKARFKTNVVRNSQYSDLLEAALSKYRNRSIETAQLIEELIELATRLNAQVTAGNPDGLSDYEVSFYDALEANSAAVREMKHDDLGRLAQQGTKKVRENIKVYGSVRESTQAALRVMVRDLLDRYGYPPDFSNQAIETVILQAESLTEEWLELDNQRG
jgi:type I restriction enzyme R subunit